MAGQRGIFISLGSNMGDREGFLKSSLSLLEAAGRIRILRKSEILENKALLYEDQPDFLNQLAEIETDLTPHELLAVLKETEEKTGRIERFRYGPREIDLDILVYGNFRSDGPDLKIPHPGIADREYIRILLREFGESPESLISEIHAGAQKK